MEYASTAWYGATPIKFSLWQLADKLELSHFSIICRPIKEKPLICSCYNWMLFRDVLFASLNFLRMTFSPIKFSLWQVADKLELSHFSIVCRPITEKPLSSCSNCFLYIISWIRDALSDPTTLRSKYPVPTSRATKDLLFHLQPVPGILCLNLFLY